MQGGVFFPTSTESEMQGGWGHGTPLTPASEEPSLMLPLQWPGRALGQR